MTEAKSDDFNIGDCVALLAVRSPPMQIMGCPDLTIRFSPEAPKLYRCGWFDTELHYHEFGFSGDQLKLYDQNITVLPLFPDFEK